ncbi:MAG: hypothetical protein EOO73_03750 [Myxococcales bacterium]|nr:MAG: hypothetical protein EOO73_03750 [Myxococcales bacterium]
MVESSGADAFVSGLGKGREAFHSEVTEYSLRIGERTPEDFLRHFSCSKIMISLASRPMERARIISELTGVHERVANKLSPENAGETLQIALDEGVTTPKEIVRLFQADDRQRYLNRHELWAFDIEGQPWKASASDSVAHGRAEKFIAYLIDRAIDNLLISHEEIVSALGVVKLAGWLPSEMLGQIIETALKKSDKFTEEDLLRAAPASSLVAHVPLDYLWEKVVVPLIAEQHDYAPKAGSGAQVGGVGSGSPLGGGAGNSPLGGSAAPGSPLSGESGSGWSFRPAPDLSAKPEEKDAAPPSSSSEEGDMVGEDEIIETEDEVRPSEGAMPVAGRKGPPRKAQSS